MLDALRLGERDDVPHSVDDTEPSEENVRDSDLVGDTAAVGDVLDDEVSVDDVDAVVHDERDGVNDATEAVGFPDCELDIVPEELCDAQIVVLTDTVTVPMSVVETVGDVEILKVADDVVVVVTDKESDPGSGVELALMQLLSVIEVDAVGLVLPVAETTTLVDMVGDVEGVIDKDTVRQFESVTLPEVDLLPAAVVDGSSDLVGSPEVDAAPDALDSRDPLTVGDVDLDIDGELDTESVGLDETEAVGVYEVDSDGTGVSVKETDDDVDGDADEVADCETLDVCVREGVADTQLVAVSVTDRDKDVVTDGVNVDDEDTDAVAHRDAECVTDGDVVTDRDRVPVAETEDERLMLGEDVVELLTVMVAVFESDDVTETEAVMVNVRDTDCVTVGENDDEPDPIAAVAVGVTSGDEKSGE